MISVELQDFCHNSFFLKCVNCNGGVLQQTSLQRGLMIVEELGEGLGFMFGMREREMRELAVTPLSVEQPSCMNDLSLFLSLSSYYVFKLKPIKIIISCFFLGNQTCSLGIMTLLSVLQVLGYLQKFP